ncbi:MAG: 50S ribosomal protein L21 [Candidatus Marinimicrobia bacterium]|nr:50S ribosomal protein L21 [Candidatus Neomarinimicrobiota bacterium]
MIQRETYAVAEIAGKQIILEPGKQVNVPKLKDYEEGNDYIADKILYLRNGDDVEIGEPYLEDKEIKTKILEHTRGKKITVFKKKRRKRYKIKRGHRQHYTVIEVEDFS